MECLPSPYHHHGGDGGDVGDGEGDDAGGDDVGGIVASLRIIFVTLKISFKTYVTHKLFRITIVTI